MATRRACSAPLISVSQDAIFGINSGYTVHPPKLETAQHIAGQLVDAVLSGPEQNSQFGGRARLLLVLLLFMADPELDFTVAGKRVTLAREQVIRSAKGVAPDTIRTHAVVVGGVRYPVKQVVAVATGMDPLDFNTNQARVWLRRLGFVVERVGGNPRRMLRG